MKLVRKDREIQGSRQWSAPLSTALSYKNRSFLGQYLYRMKDYLDDVNYWLSNKMISAKDAVKKVIDSKTPYF